ncbi:hypothetical protein [Frateuria sp. Soil773]|uniref:hypothetical protein n=1 Tax=Frateuria sp. Soil773 TaxID=1736407 RepID=UPI001F18907E|nr:hypothetical protein [Frateuria sp. Soil773]
MPRGVTAFDQQQAVGQHLGWIAAGHQIGAASAAFFAGFMRTQGGSYLQPFVIASITGLIAAGIAVAIRRQPGQMLQDERQAA